jgi:hypothetical protein
VTSSPNSHLNHLSHLSHLLSDAHSFTHPSASSSEKKRASTLAYRNAYLARSQHRRRAQGHDEIEERATIARARARARGFKRRFFSKPSARDVDDWQEHDWRWTDAEGVDEEGVASFEEQQESRVQEEKELTSKAYDQREVDQVVVFGGARSAVKRMEIQMRRRAPLL